jgi:hypothetical protein
MVTIKQGEFFYKVPMHEFSRYWVPSIIKNLDHISLERLPNDIPIVSRQAALMRGKGMDRG